MVKKIICLILSLTLVFCLSGCQKEVEIRQMKNSYTVGPTLGHPGDIEAALDVARRTVIVQSQNAFIGYDSEYYESDDFKARPKNYNQMYKETLKEYKARIKDNPDLAIYPEFVIVNGKNLIPGYKPVTTIIFLYKEGYKCAYYYAEGFIVDIIYRPEYKGEEISVENADYIKNFKEAAKFNGDYSQFYWREAAGHNVKYNVRFVEGYEEFPVVYVSFQHSGYEVQIDISPGYCTDESYRITAEQFVSNRAARKLVNNFKTALKEAQREQLQ